MTLDMDPTDATGEDPGASFDLWDYRRRVHEAYRSARQGGSGEETWLAWREARDELYRSHAQSAVEPEDRAVFGGIPYFPYEPVLRFEVKAEPVIGEKLAIRNSGQGETGFRRIGLVRLCGRWNRGVADPLLAGRIRRRRVPPLPKWNVGARDLLGRPLFARHGQRCRPRPPGGRADPRLQLRLPRRGSSVFQVPWLVELPLRAHSTLH